MIRCFGKTQITSTSTTTMARHIAGLLAKPERWTQGALGRRADGSAVNNFDILFTTNAAGHTEEHDNAADVKAFSLHGAVVRCYTPDTREKVLEKLRAAIRQITGKTPYIAQFNDSPETTFGLIAQVVRYAEV